VKEGINTRLAIGLLGAILLFVRTPALGEEIFLQSGTTRTNDKPHDIVYTKSELLRLDISWVEIETEDDVFNWENRLDQFIQVADQYGFKVVPVLRTGQCWATGFPDPPERQYPSYPPEDLSSEWHPDWGYSRTYYDFVSTVVWHYIDHFSYIIVENEANGKGMWSGTPQQYLKVLATAYSAAHEVNPDIQVFTDGTSSCIWGLLIASEMLESGSYTPEEILDFVAGYFAKHPDFEYTNPEELIDYLENNPGFLRQKEFVEYELAHLNGIMDGFNFHFAEPYWYMKDVVEYFSEIFEENQIQIDNLILDELAERNLTEPLTQEEEEEYAGLVLKNIVEAFHLGCTQIYWFPFNEKNLEHLKFGILDHNGDRRIATESFRFFNENILRRYEYASRDTIQNTDIIRSSFRAISSGKDDFSLMWWDDGSHEEGADSVIIDFPDFADSVSCFDYTGNELTVEQAGRKLGLKVTEQPVFVLWSASSKIGESDGGAPSVSRITLENGRPNPFNPTTTIPFSVEASTDDLVLSIYDLKGTCISSLAEGAFAPGRYSVIWNGRNHKGKPVSSGVYFCRLTSGQESVSRKLVLIK